MDTEQNIEQGAPENTVSFIDNLPEDIRGEASLQDFKDVGGLAKSYVNAQRMLGGSIRIPGKDSSDDDKKEFLNKLQSVDGVMQAPNFEDPESMGNFYNSLGRPARSDEYSYDFPESFPVEKAYLDEFKNVAHEAGLTSKQYEAVMGAYSKEINDSLEFSNDVAKQYETKVKEMWGNEYSAKMGAVSAVRDLYVEKYPEAMQDLLAGPNGSNPALLSMMAELSGTFKEKGALTGANAVQFGTSPEEALEKISEIKSNKDHPYWSGDSAAVERVNKLFKIAYSS